MLWAGQLSKASNNVKDERVVLDKHQHIIYSRMMMHVPSHATWWSPSRQQPMDQRPIQLTRTIYCVPFLFIYLLTEASQN